jgi:hypothetical protein
MQTGGRITLAERLRSRYGVQADRCFHDDRVVQRWARLT